MSYRQFFTRFHDRAEAGSLPTLSFREYMETCMFHPEVGYYASGRVQIGMGRDYWTYPVRLSPLFGELVALRVMDLWRALRERVESADGRFHVVEVGGGRGELLRDVRAGLRRRAHTDAEAAALLERLELWSVDKSVALLADQQKAHDEMGVRHVEAPADQLSSVLPRPFFGMVLANELLTQLSVELIETEQGQARRLRVLPWCAEPLHGLTEERPDHGQRVRSGRGIRPGFRPLRRGALPELIETLSSDEALLRRFATGDIVEWTGSLEPLNMTSEGPTARYLASSWRSIERLGKLDALPAWVAFAPGARGVLDGLAGLLSSGAGAFLTVDYGGTSYHVFDPASMQPHVRTFSRLLDGDPDRPQVDEYAGQTHNPIRAPGLEDLTYDLDFTWVAAHLRQRGLELAFYGAQGALESGLDLWKQPYQDILVAGRREEGYEGVDAIQQAHTLLKRFRHAAGFKLLVMTTPRLAHAFEGLGGPDPIRDGELKALAKLPKEKRLRSRLDKQLRSAGLEGSRAEEVAEGMVEALHPTGSPVDDVADAGYYPWRHALLRALG